MSKFVSGSRHDLDGEDDRVDFEFVEEEKDFVDFERKWTQQNGRETNEMNIKMKESWE